MRAHFATADQFYDFPGVKSRTARGWSDESRKLRGAEVLSISDFYDLPASRLRLYENNERLSEMLDAAQDLKNILAVFRTRLSENMCDQIGKRISVLIDATEWDIKDEAPNPESFRMLLSFLAVQSRLLFPSIFLNRYGLFTASWRPEKRKLASLVFHTDDRVNWLVFSPREDDETETNETAGRSSSKSVLEEVGKHGALRWMRRPSWLARLFSRLQGNA